MKKQWIIGAVAVAAAAVLAFALLRDLDRKQTQRTFFAMDTVCTLQLTGRGGETAADALESAVQTLDTEVLSRHAEGSVVQRLNAAGGGTVPALLADALAQMQQVSAASNGAFDYTLGAVSDLWDFGGEPAVPNSQTLRETLAHTGWQKLLLDGDTVTWQDPALVLDPGAVGKGLALDALREALAKTPLRSAVISLGGSVLLWGDRSFTVGIKTPGGQASDYLAKLTLEACCVSTSGSYERYFEQDGVRYHHILDPATGMPVQNGLVSVTVVSQSGLLSDALSTACFVLGRERGMALAAAFGCEAVFVEETGAVAVTSGLRDRLEITDSAYALND